MWTTDVRVRASVSVRASVDEALFYIVVHVGR